MAQGFEGRRPMRGAVKLKIPETANGTPSAPDSFDVNPLPQGWRRRADQVQTIGSSLN